MIVYSALAILRLIEARISCLAFGDEKTIFSFKKKKSILKIKKYELHKILVLMRHVCRLTLAANPCFLISLTLYSILPSPCKMHFGVKKENDNLVAHAWVEWQNTIFTTTQNTNSFNIVRVVEKCG